MSPFGRKRAKVDAEPDPFHEQRCRCLKGGKVPQGDPGHICERCSGRIASPERVQFRDHEQKL